MRQFEDEAGLEWTADVTEASGVDYKGRFHLVMRAGDDEVFLDDVRWNSERSAARTLETMSVVELRRRLRSARGRASGGVAVDAG
jgi:hypothetical protein